MDFHPAKLDLVTRLDGELKGILKLYTEVGRCVPVDTLVFIKQRESRVLDSLCKAIIPNLYC